MADKNTEVETTKVSPAPIADAGEASSPKANSGERELADRTDKKVEAEASNKDTKESEPTESVEKTDDAKTKTGEDEKKPAANTDVKDAKEASAPDAAVAPETPSARGKNARRKSAAGESKGKTLNKKGSKARLTHIDAQPGDHFLVKLKGFPAWPAIICDETMLPLALVNSRPVAAARPDGTYTEAYADGGKRVHDRSFPVMYLFTNEFGWVTNTSLSELTAEKAQDSITEKMRKDLKGAFELAAEHHSVDHYKDILKSFQEELIAIEEAKREAAATPKKSKKSKAKAVEEEEEQEEEDVDMADVEPAPPKSKSKKRKAEEETSTPQRSESAKKPKIKLNTSSTPKVANGAGTPKVKEGSAAKVSKPKPKKGKDGAEKKAEASKEAKMTPEEKHARKEKEVLYLRHKLQRGLLTREQQPQEDEMKNMSDFITMLENFADLEGSIIRATKINKVLKAILKLNSIPKEEEFRFKERSQALLDKWNKLLASDGDASNGVNGTSKKTEANGVKENGEESKKVDSDNAEGSGSKKKSDASKSEAKAEKLGSESAPATSEAVAAEAE